MQDYLLTSWKARRFPWKKREHFWKKNIGKKISFFLAYSTPRPPMSVHTKYSAQSLMLLASYRQHIFANVLFYYIDEKIRVCFKFLLLKYNPMCQLIWTIGNNLAFLGVGSNCKSNVIRLISVKLMKFNINDFFNFQVFLNCNKLQFD